LRQQRIAGAVHALGELGIGHSLAVHRADRRLGAAAFADVPVDERHRDVEARRKPDRVVRTEVYSLHHL
jgi:hypothetical protein